MRKKKGVHSPASQEKAQKKEENGYNDKRTTNISSLRKEVLPNIEKIRVKSLRPRKPLLDFNQAPAITNPSTAA